VKFSIGFYKFNRYSVPLLIADAVLLAVSFTLAFIAIYHFDLSVEQWILLGFVIAPVVLSKLIIFYFAGIYRRIWRYASIGDFWLLACTNIFCSIILLLVLAIFPRLTLPWSVAVVDGIIALFLTMGIRFARRGFSDLRVNDLRSIPTKPILIIGAGYSGSVVLKEMLSRPELSYQPVGFIDDDASKQGMRIHGVRVLGTRKQLAQIISRFNIEEVIVCMPHVSREIIREIVFQCREAGIKCRTLPGIYQIIDETVSLGMVRDVGVEDILGRDPVDIDLNEVARYLHSKVVMVAGAGGSIGKELCRQISRTQPSELILLDQSEENIFAIQQELANAKLNFPVEAIIADITNRNRINTVFSAYKPAIIFHAAAYKHVPLMESNLVEAVENNIMGTKILCEMANQQGAERFVFISTDKAVEPGSMMGLSKAICEKVVQYYSSGSGVKFSAVRFGNVLDSSGSVVPTFREQIAHGGPITVTHPDMKRFFMTIVEATQLVIQAGAVERPGSIFILDMGEQVPILELANNMIRLSGFEPGKDINIEFCGRRPGEKMCEKLSWDYEKVARTEYDKIMVVENTSTDFERFFSDLIELEAGTLNCDAQAINIVLARMCQDYLHFTFS
jgi:FlaA1/EpsC-like NDP-sugar epimerase